MWLGGWFGGLMVWWGRQFTPDRALAATGSELSAPAVPDDSCELRGGGGDTGLGHPSPPEPQAQARGQRSAGELWLHSAAASAANSMHKGIAH